MDQGHQQVLRFTGSRDNDCNAQKIPEITDQSWSLSPCVFVIDFFMSYLNTMYLYDLCIMLLISKIVDTHTHTHTYRIKKQASMCVQPRSCLSNLS